MDGTKAGMVEERYPGERQGLGLFLEELAPIVVRELGRAHLLHHAIRRALKSQKLAHLRHARGLFNSLSREERQRLQAGMVAQPERLPARQTLLDDYRNREPQPFVAIDSEIGIGVASRPHIDLRHELLDDVALRILVRPGTLPSAVARRLREIARLIETDRRLLSGRYWRAARMRLVADDDRGRSGSG